MWGWAPSSGFAATPPAPAAAATPVPVRLPAAPGDRVAEFAGDRPAAVLIWAEFSRPAVLEKRIVEELLATGSALAGKVRLIALDLDSAADSPRIEALGGAPALPVLYLLSARGVVLERFVGWPARNPTALRAVLTRELAALARE
ncbi:MAG: hypothetical protein FJZ01_19610 [Candidatus Sericytochromatia bacterium]|nr:hypothetical protein [Candidatus Tanganyikabacteria bacterium]